MLYYSYRNGAGGITLLAALLTVLTIPAVAAAQEQEIDVQTTARVTLGKSAAQPNETALVPVYFIPPKSIPIGRVQFNVTFVSVNMKFEKVEPGPVAEAGKVSFQTEVKPGKNENGVETATVTVQAEVPEQSAEGLPAGLLAYLSMRLSPEARPAQITLRASAAEVTRLRASDAVPQVRAFDAQMEVQVPGYSPTAVCFFFSH